MLFRESLLPHLRQYCNR